MRSISTDDAPSSPFLSQAMEHYGVITTSGQIHIKTDGTLIKGSMKDKTVQVMKNLEAILTAADTDFSRVLKATVYVTSMSDYDDFNEQYVTYFDDAPPAREVVCVKELPLKASLEISMIVIR